VAAVQTNARHITHEARLRTCWLDAQRLRTTIIEMGFTEPEDRRLIIEAVNAIARTARIDKSEHRPSKLAAIKFDPDHSPTPMSGLPPTISLADLLMILDSRRSVAYVRRRHPSALSRKALFRCRRYANRLAHSIVS